MTKKDYEAIARELNRQYCYEAEEAQAVKEEDREWALILQGRAETINNVAVGLAEVFERDNPRFDGFRFLAAVKAERN